MESLEQATELQTPEVTNIEEAPAVPSVELTEEQKAKATQERDFSSLREHKKALERDLKTERESKIALEKEREYYRGQLEALTAHTNINEKPKWENFNGDADAYAAAVAAHNRINALTKNHEAQTKQQEQSAKANSEREQVKTVFGERLKVLADHDQEYKVALDNIAKGAGSGINDDVVHALMKSPYGHEIIKHIGLSPALATELDRLDPQAQYYKLSALADLAAARGGSLDFLRPKTQATPIVVPPKVLGGGGGGGGTLSLQNARTPQEFQAALRAQLKKG